MLQQTQSPRVLSALLGCCAFLLIAFPSVAQQATGTESGGATKKGSATNPGRVTLKGEVLHGTMRKAFQPPSMCAFSDLAITGSASGPYGGFLTEQIPTLVIRPGKFAFSANFQIFSSPEKKVSGHMEGYDPGPNAELNECGSGTAFPGAGTLSRRTLSSHFVTKYTAEIRTPKSACKVSGKAMIDFDIVNPGRYTYEGLVLSGSFQTEILDSTSCGDHPAEIK